MKMLWAIAGMMMMIKMGNVEAANCYFCANGTASDIVKLTNVYGQKEINYEENGQFNRVYTDECGKSEKKTLKPIQCPYGCVLAEHVNSKAMFAGCARDGMILHSISTFQAGDQEYHMAVCSNDECNESYDSAKLNKAKPTQPTTVAQTTTLKPTTNPQLIASNGTETTTGNSTLSNDTPKSTTKKSKWFKPNSSASLSVNLGAIFAGLAFLLFKW